MKNLPVIVIICFIFIHTFSCVNNSTGPDDGNTVTDIDGNIYQTVQIGNQLWMAENLKVTHYRNGDPIPTGYNNSEWADLSTGAYCVYDNDPDYLEIYGYLYNWYAVDDVRGLAPEGWHVPSDAELMELEIYLGMSEEDLNGTRWRGTNEGSKLAGNIDLWFNGVLVNNSEFGTSGLNILPGGNRYSHNGTYRDIGQRGYFWSSTIDDATHAWNRSLYYANTGVHRYDNTSQNGFSIRCIKD